MRSTIVNAARGPWRYVLAWLILITLMSIFGPWGVLGSLIGGTIFYSIGLFLIDALIFFYCTLT